MAVWAFAAFGGLIGALQARRRGGNRLDILQYTAVYGIIFLVVGQIILAIYLRNVG